jgi:IQ calmodulin-binding motif
MLSLAPSTPIRNYNCNQSMKVAAASPRSVQATTCFSPREGSQEETTKVTPNALKKTVESQVSFRTAARRFSNHSTVVVPPSPMCVKQHLPPSIPRTPNTTGSTHPKIKVGLTNPSSQPPMQQRPTLPTMEPLDTDVLPSTTPIKRAAASRVQRDLSFRTLAQRFATTNKIKSASTSVATAKTSLLPTKPKTSKVLSSVQQLPTITDCEPRDLSPQRPSIVFETEQRRNSTGASIAESADKAVNVKISAIASDQSRRSSINKGEITLVSLMSPVAAKKIYTPLSSPAKGTQSDCLSNNKVFQKRYNAAATNIQRVYRGHIHRYEVARIISAVRIQTIVRQYVQQRIVQKYNAATLIQKIFRGFATRLRSKVYQLEYQLHQIQQCHARELLDIQQKKEGEITSINEVIGQEHLKYMEEKQKLQNTIDDANRIIQYLRKENKKVRDKNETLRVAIDQLIEENDMLERQADEYKEFAANLDQMKTLNDENAALISIVEQFEQRKQQFDDAIEKRDEFIMLENKMGRLYLHQIQQMVALIEETCIDPYLVAYIEELCIKCNLPGTGLEAAAADDTIDMSERKFEM